MLGAALRKEGMGQYSPPGGAGFDSSRAAAEFFRFDAQVKQALTDLQNAENRLRYLMGLSPSDGRLIRPADEPTTARVSFAWHTILWEALGRSCELRRQRWRIKQRELELVAAKNHLLPRLDMVGLYRWRGLGDDLIKANRTGQEFFEPGSTAFENLTGGDFQEWQLGMQLQMPIGFRRELARLRHFQLLLARERAVLTEQELELTHQLATIIRNLVEHYQVMQTSLNRLRYSDQEIARINAQEAAVSLADRKLDAIRRRTEADLEYRRAVADYNRAIMQVHFRKGSLLEYDSVLLTEGPWPGKAYFDAHREARRRNAGHCLDYGFSEPAEISVGVYRQRAGNEEQDSDDPPEELSPPPGAFPTEELPSASGPSSPQSSQPDVVMPNQSMQAFLETLDRAIASGIGTATNAPRPR